MRTVLNFGLSLIWEVIDKYGCEDFWVAIFSLKC